MIKQCKLCGGEFDTGGNGKLCDRCKVQPCAMCGKPVELSSYGVTQMLKRGWVTCSTACARKKGGETSRGKPHDTHKVVVCDICGREFDGKGASKTCDECKTLTCPICGEEFHLKGAKLSRYKQQRTEGDARITCGKESCRAELTRVRLMEREGISNVFQRGEVREKLRETRLNDSEETKAKRSASLRKSLNVPEVQAKREASRQRRIEETGYGSNMEDPAFHAMMIEKAKSPEARQKAMESHAKNHDGAKTPFQMPDVIAATIARRNEKKAAEVKRVVDYVNEHPDLPGRTIARRLGMKYHTLMAYNRDFDIGINLHKSATEQEFAELLDERGVDYEREHGFEGEGQYRYDFWIGNVVVEIDPTYTHNSTHGTKFGGAEGEPKPASYHKDKSAFAMERGYRCVHVFDWDDMEKVADMFVDKRRVLEDGYSIRVIEGMDRQVLEFLDEYHLQNRCGSIDFSVCAFEGDLLVGVMAFGKPRFAKKFDLELLRYCVKPDVMLEFGARSLFAAATQYAPQKTVVSYCDMAKFDGGVYERLGFELDGTTPPSPVWFNEKTGKMFRNSYVMQRGVDQLLGTSYGKGTRNDELMLKEGFVEIYDCGQSRWVYAR